MGPWLLVQITVTISFWMISRVKHPLAAYGLACIFVGIALAARWGLEPMIGGRAPYMLCLVAALISAVLGGVGPGLFAAVSGQFLAHYLFVKPQHAFLPNTSQDWVYWGMYNGVVLICLGIVQMLHRATVKAEESHGRTKRQEEQLRVIVREMSAAQERIRELASVVESADDAIITMSPQGLVATWNAGAEELFGYSTAEMMGRPITTVVPEDMREFYVTTLGRLLAGETVQPLEAVALTKSGQRVDISIRASALRDASGRISGISGIVRDICEAKQAEAEINRLNRDLRQNLEQTRQLMEVLPVGVAIATDASCSRIEINPAMAAMLRLKDTEVSPTESDWSAAFRLNEPERVFEQFPLKVAATENREVRGWETSLVHEGGESADLLGQAVPLRDEFGQVRGVIGAFIDITELKKAHAALQETERRFRTMADSAPLMIWMTQSEQQGVWVNKTWRKFTGRTQDLETMDGWAKPICEEERLVWRETVERAMQKRETFEAECRMRRADGEERWILGRGVPRFGRKGEFLGFIGSCMDVTEWKHAEVALETKFEELRAAQHTLKAQNDELASSRRELESERSKYQELFHSAPIGYVITTREGVVHQVNRAAAELLDDSPDILTGLPFAHLLAKTDRAAFYGNIGKLTRREVSTIVGWEVTIGMRGKKTFPCSITVNLLEDQDNRVTGLRWILRDISERRKDEERMRNLNAELEQRVKERTAALEAANKELEAFSYSVSHDLRAPLRSINGFTKAVLEEASDKLDEQSLEYLGYAYNASIRMGRLIEDLLELSRVARGDMLKQEVDLSSLANSVVADLRARYPERKIDVAVASGLRVCADLGLIRIAMENLLGNAWKFTGAREAGLIEIGEQEVDGRTCIFVRDNGAGFDMEHAGRLFGVFQRLHTQEEFAGTGIGLATVKRIINRHGGQIWAEAKIDAGATFYFWLPCGPLSIRPEARGANVLRLRQPEAPAESRENSRVRAQPRQRRQRATLRKARAAEPVLDQRQH